MRKVVLLFMAVVLSISQLWAQQRTVTGKVSDENGNALANVSIKIKGTNTGTASGIDGFYSLIVPSTAKTLVFTYVDMEEMEVSVGEQLVINATLKRLASRSRMRSLASRRRFPCDTSRRRKSSRQRRCFSCRPRRATSTERPFRLMAALPRASSNDQLLFAACCG